MLARACPVLRRLFGDRPGFVLFCSAEQLVRAAPTANEKAPSSDARKSRKKVVSPTKLAYVNMTPQEREEWFRKKTFGSKYAALNNRFLDRPADWMLQLLLDDCNKRRHLYLTDITLRSTFSKLVVPTSYESTAKFIAACMRVGIPSYCLSVLTNVQWYRLFINEHTPLEGLWTAFAERNHAADCIKLWNHMLHQRVVPDQLALTSTVKACTCSGQPVVALAVLHQARDFHQIPPTPELYHQIVWSYVTLKDKPLRALQVFAEMGEQNIAVLPDTTLLAIRAGLKLEHLDWCLEEFANFVKAHQKVPLDTEAELRAAVADDEARVALLDAALQAAPTGAVYEPAPDPDTTQARPERPFAFKDRRVVRDKDDPFPPNIPRRPVRQGY